MKNTLSLSTGFAALSLMTLGAWLAPAPAPPAPAALASGAIPISALPFEIENPGSYYVTGPLNAAASGGGIEIADGVRDVVIDLCDFTLTGVGAADNTHGIWGKPDFVVVKNGTVENFGLVGIDLGDHCRVENVNVRDCGNEGILVRAHSQVVGCHLDNNALASPASRSLVCLKNSTITDCIVTSLPDRDAVVVGNSSLARRVKVMGGESSFVTGRGARLEDCSAEDFGQTGFELSTGSTMVDCYARGPFQLAQHGIRTLEDCRVTGCTVDGRVGVGIETGVDCRVEGSIVSETHYDGIRAGENTRVADCTVTGCNSSGTGGGAGVIAARNVQVEDTNSSYNTGAGIHFQAEGGVVRDCVTADNSGDGIRLAQGTSVRGSWSANNQDAGLRVAGDRVWVRENNLDGNSWGLVVEGQDSLIVGNRAADNSTGDYSVPYGNPLGPVNKNSGTIQGSVPQANFKTPL